VLEAIVIRSDDCVGHGERVDGGVESWRKREELMRKIESWEEGGRVGGRVGQRWLDFGILMRRSSVAVGLGDVVGDN
jgi:hypothetical protein